MAKARSRVPDSARRDEARGRSHPRVSRKAAGDFMKSTTFRYTDDDGATPGWCAFDAARGRLRARRKSALPVERAKAAIPAKVAGAEIVLFSLPGERPMTLLARPIFQA
jgi:hypothetical protein